MGRRIPVHRKTGDVFVVVGEGDSAEFDWLIDEDGMEIVSVYIIDEVDEEHSEEERNVYEFHVKP